VQGASYTPPPLKLETSFAKSTTLYLSKGLRSLHIPPILPSHVIQRMTDLAE